MTIQQFKLKELLDIAKSQLQDLTKVQNPDFRLEQAVYNKNEDEWVIVVSFLVEKTNKRINTLGLPSFELEFQRIFKKLTINSTKEITGLYIFNAEDSN